MTVERPNDRPAEQAGERQAERDSQLSAMFDGELPGAECELLARRLTRDEALRAQWSRYALIGAALRAERGVALHDRVALRVQSVIAKEATYGDSGGSDVARPAAATAAPAAARSGWRRLAYPMAGASIAAGVAAVSILWLRGVEDPGLELQASAGTPTIVLQDSEPAPLTAAASLPSAADSATTEPDLYSTPAPSSATNLAPPARLANYVVAHSEYSGPISRRMALLGIVGAEGLQDSSDNGSAPVPAEAPVTEERRP